MKTIEIKNYINGKFSETDDFVINDNAINDIDGPKAKIYFCNDWDLTAAIETATLIQPKLRLVSSNMLADLLSKTMEYYFNSNEDYLFLTEMTGSPYRFLRYAINGTKEWVKDFKNFYTNTFRSVVSSYIFSSNPTFAILPSNAEQISLFVIAQSIMAKSALIIRSSSRNAGSFTSVRFVEAWNKVIDELNPDLHFLKKIVNIVNYKNIDDLWKHVSIDDWNYICFGSRHTINNVVSNINQYATPRKFVDYGYGFSNSVIDSSALLNLDYKNQAIVLNEITQKVLISATENTGNQCTATDVVYVHKDVYEMVFKALKHNAVKYKSLDPKHPESIGVVSPNNVKYIEQGINELHKREHLNVQLDANNNKVIHASVVPLSRYEYASEYPGPILFVKSYDSETDLLQQMAKELEVNDVLKYLSSSVFASKTFFNDIAPKLRTYKLKYDKPSHEVNLYYYHQGKNLLDELTELTIIEEKY